MIPKGILCLTGKQMRKIIIGNLRHKWQKTLSEQLIQPDEEMYKDLFIQYQILKEVIGVYSNLFKKLDMDPNYQEIIRALIPHAVKLLTEAKLQLTEKLISTTKLIEALRRIKNNTAPGSSALQAASTRHSVMSLTLFMSGGGGKSHP